MTPRWLSWLFVLAIGYLIYLGNQSHHIGSTPAETEAARAMHVPPLKDYPTLEAFADSNRWQRALTPGYVGVTKITEVKSGAGPVAHCGEEVTAHVAAKLSNGKTLEEVTGHLQPLQFRLGVAPYPVLNEAIEGMQEGGVRHVVAPPQRVISDKSAAQIQEDIVMDVTLNHVQQPETSDDRLAAKQLIDQEGDGPRAACGTPVKLQFVLWSAAGDAAYRSTKPIQVTPGSEGMPMALATGLSGMRKGETRTLLLPPLQEKITGLPTPIAAALAAHRVTIVTVTRVE